MVGPARRGAAFVALLTVVGLALASASALFLHAERRASAVAGVVTVAGSAPSVTAGRGAGVPFVEQEAAEASTNATVLAKSWAWDTLAGEAVGRRAVTLSGRGQYVQFTLTQPANSLDLRYSIPDTADGSVYDAALSVYLDGERARDLTLTNRYAWYYGAYPFTNTPSSGNPHHFYDEVHELLGRELPAGTKVRFQVDAGDTASSYTIDLVDFEDVAPASIQPAGSLSVTDYGADPTGARDSSSAFASAIAASLAQGRSVWIPAGSFLVTKHIVVGNNVTMLGAGEWYSVLTGAGVGIYGNSAPTPSTNVHLSNFAIDGTIDVRDDAAAVNAIGGAMGGGSTISDIWVEHTKAGLWFDGPFDGLTVSRVRIDDTAADGINLHDGITHATITDTFVRNTGDDGIAAWSEQNADSDDVISFDTVEVPVLANNFAIYGGADNQLTDDVASDTQTQGGGIHVGNRFNAVAVSGTTTIARDTTLRAGVLDPNWKYGIGALWFWSDDSPMTGAVRVDHVHLIDSAYEGVQFTGSSIDNVDLADVDIAGAGTFAVQLESHGSARFTRVVATNVGASAGIYDCLFTGSAASAFTVTDAGGNSGWRTRFCGPWPTPVHTYLAPKSPAHDDFSVALDSASGSLGAGGSTTVDVTTAVTSGGAQRVVLSAGGAPAGVKVGFGQSSLSAGGSTVMTVSTTPSTVAGRYPIQLNASAPSGSHAATYVVVVTQGGRGALTATPSSLTFGGAEVGTSSPAQDVRLRNTGLRAIALSAVHVDGDFEQTNDCLSSLPPGATCTVSVTLTATAAGARAGELSVSSDTNPVAVGLTGSASGSSNLALGKTVTASGTQDGYPPSNATDGNTGSYWESTNHAFPQWVSVDLGSVQRISRIVLQLPPIAAWTTRTQTLSVLASTDGTAFATILAAADYTFDPSKGNTVTIRLPATNARYVRVLVTANDGWPAAQLSELEVTE